MSKIDELLKNEKVEWKKLGEIATCFAGGTPKTTNKSYYDGEIPWIRSGEIKFNIIKSSERNITIEGLNNSSAKLIRPNSVVVAMTGATVGRSAVVEFETSSNQSVAAIETNESIIKYKYLFYYLADKYEELKGMGQGALTSLNLGTIKKLIIPIPSLKTQEKIVEILDKFTDYVTELQAELQAELQDRTKQYEYYRDMLLSEDYLNKLCKNPQINSYKIRLTTLGEIGVFTRGNGLQKKDFVLKGKPVIHYGQIYTKYNFESNKTFSFVNEEVFSKLKKANCNDILIATTSENIEDVGKAVVWLGDEEIGFSGDMYSYSTTQNSKYIAYYLQTTEFQRQKEKKVTGTKLIRIHGNDMAKFFISLPPIKIQNKVVEVLDKFQSLLADTEGLLPQEIEQRQKQYEYFREKLLTFDENVVQVKSSQVKSSQVKSSQVLIARGYFDLLEKARNILSLNNISNKVKLCDICKYSNEKIEVHSLNKHNYVGVDNLLKDKKGKIESDFVPIKGKVNLYNKDDILIGNIRPYLKKIWMAEYDGGANGDVLIFSIRDEYKSKIIPRFLYFNLSSDEFFDYDIGYSKGAKMPRGDKKAIMKFKIPVPPIAVQEHVVSILDKFDELINDISTGIPKEIELRQKEYEYYRERLLSFPR